jgi:phage-related protein
MVELPYTTRDLIWMGDSKEELSRFPLGVKRKFGFALRQVQNGETPEIARPLTGYSGVHELKDGHGGNAYRAVYAIKIGKSVYVLDAFMKKSKRGKKLPREIKERIAERLAAARRLGKE